MAAQHHNDQFGAQWKRSTDGEATDQAVTCALQCFEPLAVGLTSVFASCSRSGTFHPPCSSCGEVVSQPLRPGLANMQLSADRAHRGNPVRREVVGEQFRRLLL
jgi:hypothetical protein